MLGNSVQSENIKIVLENALQRLYEAKNSKSDDITKLTLLSVLLRKVDLASFPLEIPGRKFNKKIEFFEWLHKEGFFNPAFFANTNDANFQEEFYQILILPLLQKAADIADPGQFLRNGESIIFAWRLYAMCYGLVELANVFKKEEARVILQEKAAVLDGNKSLGNFLRDYLDRIICKDSLQGTLKTTLKLQLNADVSPENLAKITQSITKSDINPDPIWPQFRKITHEHLVENFGQDDVDAAFATAFAWGKKTASLCPLLKSHELIEQELTELETELKSRWRIFSNENTQASDLDRLCTLCEKGYPRAFLILVGGLYSGAFGFVDVNAARKLCDYIPNKDFYSHAVLQMQTKYLAVKNTAQKKPERLIQFMRDLDSRNPFLSALSVEEENSLIEKLEQLQKEATAIVFENKELVEPLKILCERGSTKGLLMLAETLMYQLQDYTSARKLASLVQMMPNIDDSLKNRAKDLIEYSSGLMRSSTEWVRITKSEASEPMGSISQVLRVVKINGFTIEGLLAQYGRYLSTLPLPQPVYSPLPVPAQSSSANTKGNVFQSMGSWLGGSSAVSQPAYTPNPNRSESSKEPSYPASRMKPTPSQASSVSDETSLWKRLKEALKELIETDKPNQWNDRLSQDAKHLARVTEMLDKPVFYSTCSNDFEIKKLVEAGLVSAQAKVRTSGSPENIKNCFFLALKTYFILAAGGKYRELTNFVYTKENKQVLCDKIVTFIEENCQQAIRNDSLRNLEKSDNSSTSTLSSGFNWWLSYANSSSDLSKNQFQLPELNAGSSESSSSPSRG